MKTIRQSEFDSVIKSGKPVVVEFSAPWCPDCVYINPYLPKLEADNPEFEFYAMDRDENLDLCEKLDVLGIPSFIVFDNGKEVSRFVSTLRKTPEEVQAFLNKTKEEIHGQL